MQKVVIKGPSTLKGQIKISGSKNASLPIIISTLLAKGECLIHNVPNLRDTRFLISILKDLGFNSYPSRKRSWRNSVFKHINQPNE